MNISAHDQAYQDFGGKVVKVYAFSSEDNAKLQEVAKAWKLQHTTFLGDPSNGLVDYLKEKYVPDVVVSDDKRYPNGMVQPAELVFFGSKLVVAWTKQPKAANGFGAIGRPDATKMWKFIETNLDQVDTVTCSNGEEFTSGGMCVVQ